MTTATDKLAHKVYSSLHALDGATNDTDHYPYHFQLRCWPRKPCKSYLPTKNSKKTLSDERFQLKDRNSMLNSNVFQPG